MRSKKSILKTIVSVVAIALFVINTGIVYLSASSNTTVSDNVSENTMEDMLQGFSQRSQDRPVLVIGDDNYYPPYSFLDRNGNPAGFNIELARAAGAAMGYDVIIRLDSWDKTREALEQGEIDAISGMFYSEQRAENYSFTTRHSTTSGAIFAARGHEISNIEDLSGQRIAVQKADIVAEILSELDHSLNLELELIEMASVQEALELVETGACNYAGLLKLPALYEIDKFDLENVNDQQIDFFSNDYCMAVKKGNEDLVAILNGGLQIIKADGTYQRIFDRWLGVYEPMNISNLLMQYKLIPIIAAVLLALLLMFGLIMNALVKKRTAELRRTNEVLVEKQEQLEYFSNHDALTGLYNRHFFEQTIRKLPDHIEFPFCLILGDVNNLKAINNKYGHQTGDQLLVKAAQIMRNYLTGGNIVCRIGGDEFAIIMPGVQQYEAETLIRKIRTATALEHNSHFEISISFGISCITDPNADIMEAFQQAENLMYENKIDDKSNFDRTLPETHF